MSISSSVLRWLFAFSLGAAAMAVRTHFDVKPLKASVVDAFHKLYYERSLQTWGNTYWMGTQAQKCPLDMWIYQELLFKVRPDVLVETGTAEGGSALFFAHMMDLLGRGRVITIDIEQNQRRPAHPRITYLLGSSTSDQTVDKIRRIIRPGEKVMVALDSDHSEQHVSRELAIYSPMVSSGSYLVVEDTNDRESGSGAGSAVREFLSAHSEFTGDDSCQKFFLTFFPGGWLKRL